MDRYPGYESMLARVEHMKMQVKAQLPTEYSQTVDNMVVFVLYQVNECFNVATVDATTDTTEDHPLSGGPLARADDTRIDVNEHPASPQVDHHSQGSISNEQSVSPVVPPPPATHSTIHTNIEVKVEDESNGQSVQLCEWIKKEEDEDDYEGQLFHCCGCGGEGCEECKVKREIKEELDESGETELGGNRDQVVQGCIRFKKEEEESEGERPKKMRRMDRVIENVLTGSPSPSSSTVHSSTGSSINVEYVDDHVATSSNNAVTIEDLTQPSQPVTFPLPTPIVTQTQPSSSSAQHVNEPLRDELLNAEPMMDNVALVVDLGAEEFDREQIDGDNSTVNQVHIGQEEDDETIEQSEDTSVDERQVQVTAQNFVKRIEPADELGNKFECDFQGCGWRMKLKTNLITHIRAHTGEKPFKCTVAGCDWAFVQNAQLKAHLITHSGTRPFVCTWPGCEARFSKKGTLTEHTRTHTGERPFKCDQCDTTFTYHSNLVIHLRTHTGARPFVCTWPDCGQAFTTSSNLKTHSHAHSNERRFVCDVTGCDKVYKYMTGLCRHQKEQHN